MRSRVIAFVSLFIFSLSISLNVFCVSDVTNKVITANETANSQQTNNVDENKTLEQQDKEVIQKIEETNKKLEYVQGEITDAIKKVEEYDDSLTLIQK